MNNLGIYIIIAVLLFIIYKFIKSYIDNHKVEKDFISVVNHAFRTPLTRIVWITKELEGDIPANEKMLHLQGIKNATDKILGMIDTIVGIRNINDRASYDFKSVSIREILEGAIFKNREMITSKNIAFNISPLKDIPSLTVDLKKISFVIEEIIENAIYYTPNAGTISIEATLNSASLFLYISDTGMGLDFKDKLGIFLKFYRNPRAKKINTDGIGLSLYLSKQIIKRHGGSIKAISKGINKGTTFIIELPFHK